MRICDGVATAQDYLNIKTRLTATGFVLLAGVFFNSS